MTDSGSGSETGDPGVDGTVAGSVSDMSLTGGLTVGGDVCEVGGAGRSSDSAGVAVTSS